MLARISRLVLPPLIVLAALLAYRLVAGGPSKPAIVLPRNEPLVIAPRFDDPRVVTPMSNWLPCSIASSRPPSR
jgi:hypothetical protein